MTHRNAPVTTTVTSKVSARHGADTPMWERRVNIRTGTSISSDEENENFNPRGTKSIRKHP